MLVYPYCEPRTPPPCTDHHLLRFQKEDGRLLGAGVGLSGEDAVELDGALRALALHRKNRARSGCKSRLNETHC